MFFLIILMSVVIPKHADPGSTLTRLAFHCEWYSNIINGNGILELRDLETTKSVVFISVFNIRNTELLA